jgi:hypothetical protein
MDKDMKFVPPERIERSILLIRGQKVMLDRDLPYLYGVTTKVLNQAVKRHKDRFPRRLHVSVDHERMGRFDLANCDVKRRV